MEHCNEPITNYYSKHSLQYSYVCTYLWTFCGTASCRDSEFITGASIALSGLSTSYIAQPTSNYNDNWHQPHYDTPVE